MVEPLPLYDFDDDPDDFDRLHPLGAMHGVVCSMLVGLDARCGGRARSRGEDRQRRALDALRVGLAAAVPHRHDPAIMVPATEGLTRLMRRCARTEVAGLPLAQLIRLPEPWPWQKLSWSAPGLSLIAVVRLREALENLVVGCAATAQREAQLRVVVELETALRKTMVALAGHTTSRAAAHDRADAAFWEAEDTIGDGLADIFAAEGAMTAPRRPVLVH
jgi:hypothetical protein